MEGEVAEILGFPGKNVEFGSKNVEQMSSRCRVNVEPMSSECRADVERM
jgi:hypothetical protein